MLIVTWSSLSCFQACPRRYHWRYERMLRPRAADEAEPLVFGAEIHSQLERFWRGEPMRPSVEGLADALLSGYAARRHLIQGAQPEVQFEVRIRGQRDVRLQGKVDVLIPGSCIIEHKTTSNDLSPEGEYMQALAMDGQVSTYLYATGLRYCWYDVIRKPRLRKKQDESQEQFYARVRANLDDSYYALSEVVRTDDDIARWVETMQATVRAIRRKDRPQHPQRCFDWFRACDYWPICTGQCDEHSDRYRIVEQQHEEIGI